MSPDTEAIQLTSWHFQLTHVQLPVKANSSRASSAPATGDQHSQVESFAKIQPHRSKGDLKIAYFAGFGRGQR